MNYCVEVIRDMYNNITGYNILFATSQVAVMPRGKECILLEGPSDLDVMGLQRVSIDQNGVPFIEEDPSKVALQVSEDEIKLRIRRQEFGRRIIAIMSIRNDSKNLTGPQIVQFATDYANINTALLNGSIATAKALIQAITPDGVITTQTDKDALINEIEANEANLGY
jgi:hypothetical protein